MSQGVSMDGAPSNRPEWTSQRAFIIASVASVVGLGNLWRFPYMVGENGGGSFIAAYLVCIIAVGLPLFVLETSGGGLVDRGPVGVFQRAGGRWGAWIGWAIVAVIVTLMSYYFVVTGWTLGYFADALRFNVRPFDDFTSGYASVWWFLAVGVLVFLVLRKGTGSIERLGKALLPMLAVLVAGLAVYGQTLDGAAEARSFYASFSMDVFLSPQTWQMAAGQAFYSLGVGTGVLITFGSYVPKNVNLITSSVAIALTNSAISLCAGVMVFSIVFTFGLAPDEGSQLSFTAFPRIFEGIAGGALLAAVYFGLLFVAAFSSCYSGLAAGMAPLRDQLHLSPTVAALLLTSATLALGLPSALSFSSPGLELGGRPFLEWVDRFSGSGVIIALGIGGAALIAWRLPKADLVWEMTAGRWQSMPLALLPHIALEAGRFMPAAALLLLSVTTVV